MINKNKTFLFFSIIFNFSFLPLVTSAGIVSHGPFAENFVLPKDTVIQEDYYVFGGNINIFGTVEGDTSVIGGEIIFNGNTKEDALFVSPYVEVNGTTGDDVRILAGQGLINTTILGDLVAVVGEMELSKDSNIFGSLLLFSGELIAEGDIAGDIKVYGDNVYINGFVGGDVKVVGKNVSFGDRAKIAGDIIWAGNEPKFVDGAVIIGEIKQSETLETFFFGESSKPRPLIPFFLVLKSLMILVVLIFFSLVFPKMTRQFTEKGVKASLLLRNALIGFGLFIGSVVVGGILLVSLVGSLFGILILAVFLAFFVFSIAGGALLLGRGIFGLIVRENLTIQPLWKLSLVGTVGMFVFEIVPILGSVVSVFFVFASFGSVALFIYHMLRGSDEASLPVLPQQ